jgi:hypothetical protein
MRKFFVVLLTIIGVGFLVHGIAIVLEATKTYWLF